MRAGFRRIELGQSLFRNLKVIQEYTLSFRASATVVGVVVSWVGQSGPIVAAWASVKGIGQWPGRIDNPNPTVCTGLSHPYLLKADCYP
jgi:hypothetical protein